MHTSATTGKRELNTTEETKILLCNDLSVTNHEPYYDTCNVVLTIIKRRINQRIYENQKQSIYQNRKYHFRE